MSKPFLAVYAVCIVILSFRLITFYQSQKTYKQGEDIIFTTQIDSNPKFSSYYQTVYVNIDALNKVLIKTDVDRNLAYGDYIKVSGRLKTILLNDRSTIFTLDHPKIEANFRENVLPLAVVYSIRQKIIANFKSNLDPVSAGLMLGIVFGIKENLPKEFLEDIQITGVMHVIAASGMNVTMVSGFLFYIFGAFFRRQTAILLSVLGIFFYTGLAGFEASIVRAAIMGTIVFSAQALGRQTFALNTLLITAFFMFLVRPDFLVDTGFQLSFAATLGLLYIPNIFKKIQNSFTESFITTFSAQLATLPILVSNFGNYSLWSIVVNGLILWTVPILMILGAVAAFFSFVFPLASSLILYLCLPFLYFFESIVTVFGNLKQSFAVESLPWPFTLSYYLLLTSIIVFKVRK
ncbi:MAG: ComEC/Rec2 family competence protein [Candidatus Levybacteria bacterium]|nr:ComEC/Rec2 family competence protein [Candidatus Levybacteria bacterium]